MNRENYQHFETEQGVITVTFAFPRKNEREECIKSEIKGILTCVLQQCLTKEAPQ